MNYSIMQSTNVNLAGKLESTVKSIIPTNNFTYTIYNAYPSDIWIACASSKLELTNTKVITPIASADAEGATGNNVEFELKKVTHTSWSKLAPGSQQKRDRNTVCTEHVTIVARKTLSDAQYDFKNLLLSSVLVYEYPVEQNSSFIITKNGEFLHQNQEDFNILAQECNSTSCLQKPVGNTIMP